ncbi:MAG TPA: acetylglutamate kinase [Cyclobacteriaceae bacterium]
MSRNNLTIVKVGGKVIDEEERLNDFLNAFSRVDGDKIIIHGGGKLATDIGKRMNISPKMIHGRRVTDRETLDLVTMVYAGLVNKKIVAKLQALNINALGLTGTDANLLEACHRPPLNGIDYGLIGEVHYVNVEVIKKLLDQNFSMVIAPLTHNKKGQIFNTNADTVASKIASGMSDYFQVQLIYAFELNGVYEDLSNEESIIERLSKSNYKELCQQAKIHTGMMPKLDNAFQAVACGVKDVVIGNYKNIDKFNHSRQVKYTKISAT